MVASFNDAALADFHQLAPEIDLAPATAAVAGYVLGGVPLPPGYKVFQVPTSFSGVPVVTQDFVDRAHADGHAVHVWTIDDEETMNTLWDYGVDGIMTAEPMRLEKNMCERKEPRLPLPKGSPGKHCAKNVSIACEPEVRNVKRVSRKKAKVTLTRKDNFDSRCAGTVTLKAIGAKRAQEGEVRLRLALARSRRPERGGREGQAQRGPAGVDRAQGEGQDADDALRRVRGSFDQGRLIDTLAEARYVCH